MILIFGGAYQGKLDYAKENFNIKTVCDCSDGREPDFSADCITGIEGFAYECAKAGKSAADWFESRRNLWLSEDGQTEKIFVVTDVSQGVVPVDADVRAFREVNGRMMLYLSGEAKKIIRVFCGLGKEVKRVL